jgi:hypothetical protein
MAFLLHFKDDGTKKYVFFFFVVLSFTRPFVLYSPTFTFPQTSKCFLSNGANNPHILASGPELKAVRFSYSNLHFRQKNNKKWADP